MTCIFALSNTHMSLLRLVSHGDNSYIYPFWVFYISEDQYVLGEDQAVTKPILVNAITGEVIMCN